VRAIPSTRRQGDPALQEHERTEFRSCVGSLQYLSGGSRPDVSAATSLIQKGEITLDELDAAYEVMRYLHTTADAGIRIVPLDLNKLMLIGYGDSSWANADESRSQTGVIVVATETSAQSRPTPCSVHDWFSRRTKRVVRSTLAAEAIACDACADHVFFLASFYSRLLHRQVPGDGHPKVSCHVCTDCRSLYDACSKVMPSLDEKRTLIDVLSIKQSLANGTLRWLPTTEQRADGLTKIATELMLMILRTMAGEPVCLVETVSSTSR